MSRSSLKPSCKITRFGFAIVTFCIVTLVPVISVGNAQEKKPSLCWPSCEYKIEFLHSHNGVLFLGQQVHPVPHRDHAGVRVIGFDNGGKYTPPPFSVVFTEAHVAPRRAILGKPTPAPELLLAQQSGAFKVIVGNNNSFEVRQVDVIIGSLYGNKLPNNQNEVTYWACNNLVVRIERVSQTPTPLRRDPTYWATRINELLEEMSHHNSQHLRLWTDKYSPLMKK